MDFLVICKPCLMRPFYAKGHCLEILLLEEFSMECYGLSWKVVFRVVVKHWQGKRIRLKSDGSRCKRSNKNNNSDGKFTIWKIKKYILLWSCQILIISVNGHIYVRPI